MKWNLVVAVGCMSLVVRVAAAADSMWAECRALKQLQTAMAETTNTQAAGEAFEVLERVALGKVATFDPPMETKLGISNAPSNNKKFDRPEVQACAFQMIAASGKHDAVEWLGTVAIGDIGGKAYEVWPAMQVALKAALLKQLDTPQEKVNLLERVLIDEQDADAADALRVWAIQKLCSQGAIASMSVVHRAIRAMAMGERAEEGIRFCEAQTNAITSGGQDRAKGLGNVLRLGQGIDNVKLMAWAVGELIELASPEANAELARFVEELAAFPRESDRRRNLGLIGQQVEAHLRGVSQRRQ